MRCSAHSWVSSGTVSCPGNRLAVEQARSLKRMRPCRCCMTKAGCAALLSQQLHRSRLVATESEVDQVEIR